MVNFYNTLLVILTVNFYNTLLVISMIDCSELNQGLRSVASDVLMIDYNRKAIDCECVVEIHRNSLSNFLRPNPLIIKFTPSHCRNY